MTTLDKKLCVNCGKSGGVFTCDGCQQSFCSKHTVVHRQELAFQFDTIGQEHDLLQQDLINDNGQDAILIRIDTWEKESIFKIRMAAEKARADFGQFREQLKMSCNQIFNELRSSSDSENYSEIDLTRWMKKLQSLRNDLEMSTNIEIVERKDKDSIDLIQVHRTIGVGNTVAISERFDEIAGSVTLSEDHLTVTILNSIGSRPLASIRGAILYSSGLHKIHFEIVNKMRNYLFFGIMSANHHLTNNAFCSSSTYGWWDVGYPVQHGHSPKHHSSDIIKTGDQIVLTLDCDQQQITYVVQGTELNEKLNVDLDSCPFPWKFLIVLDCIGNSVRVISHISS